MGAEVSIGPRALNMMPEPTTTFFVHNWLAGQKAQDAARNAYEATVPFYLPIYPPTPKIKYRTQTFKYPCPTLKDWFKMCTGSVQVPDGVEFVSHTYVTQSELIVAGNGDCQF